jgi:Tfp pilus assembly protein PilV
MYRPKTQRGISLIEALVALTVMAFGMLAYVGVQSGLRLNGDVAKQRSEAVRIAQEHIEAWRAYSRLTADASETDYAEIATVGETTVVSEASNATYVLTRTVVDTAADADAPKSKLVTVDVRWDDRVGQPQAVRLTTTIAASPPELAGALVTAASGSPVLKPHGRHPDIPVEAVQEGEVSRFTPPQPDGGTESWLFDNDTGVITSICSTEAVCTAANARLLAGHVRFAITAAQPTGADAEAPPSAAQAVEVVVDRSHPSALVIPCHEQLRTADLRYFCAVPVDPADEPPRWSGRSLVVGLPLASSVADAAPGSYRVCRYTIERSHASVPPLRNVDHPLDYVDVSGALAHQNFLVIAAGADGVPFDCPDDDTGTPLVDGTTWHHQPAT